jgi:predicted transcriptional regulator
MTKTKINSWIFLATSIASQKEPADINSISLIADGINHSIPTDKELQISLNWLLSEGLISKKGSKYSLTEIGKTKFENASKTTSVLFKIWDILDEDLQIIQS